MDVVTARLITQLPDENSLKPRKSNSKLTRVGTQGKYSKVTREGSSTTKKKSTSSSSSANTNSKSASGSKQSGKPSVLEETKLDIVPKSVNSAKYKGLVDCIVRMWNEEGPQAFFTGAVARVAWIAPFTAISLGINERLKRQFLMWKPLATVVPRRTYFFRKFY